ncbi:T9SS type A sorting domain-containing protein [Aequorivita marina]|uniref:T9SS type A sorting domain-containing protein n=1 Tax=Aequorivita marina TaxID=3073654 RepID=UPI00287438F5|nr:T9SS type A sorting domain-containing protein [Aequorivita sp. S2608]MDS1299042.1 T9SS type A sorting domain-containing protein [Aequorivita sp. S2608]
MKKFTLLITLCFISSLGVINAQKKIGEAGSSKTNGSQQTVKLPAAYFKTTTAPVRETAHGVKRSQVSLDFQDLRISSYGSYGPAAKPEGTEGFGENLIYTSGPYINDGPDLSILEDLSEDMSTFGSGAQKGSDNSVAEDFTLPMDFDINSIDVYAYQTGSTPPSITAVYMQIWDGDPSASGTVVWGDLTTNILEDVEDTEVYRVLESDQGNTDRKIQKVTANTSGLSLSTGTYWVEYTFEGSGSSGPWVPPIAVIGETITGNAIQNSAGTWQALVDGLNDDPQGLPVQIYGAADLGGNSCVEMNPPYDWLFEIGLNITSTSSYSSANDLTLAANESFTLKNITAILMSEWPITEVDVTYYDDNNGLPGAVVGSENSVTIDAIDAIGAAHGSNHNVYEVKMTVDPFEFTGDENSGTTYWIELSATSSQNTDVYWAGSYGNTVGNPMAQDDGGWGEYDSGLDGLYIWSGDCSPVLGVEDNELAQFSVYPNPTRDVLYLETNGNIESISLFNLLGQEVLAGKIDKNTTEISLASLPVGTYILKTTVAGQVQTQKIIKM